MNELSRESCLLISCVTRRRLALCSSACEFTVKTITFHQSRIARSTYFLTAHSQTDLQPRDSEPCRRQRTPSIGQHRGLRRLRATAKPPTGSAAVSYCATPPLPKQLSTPYIASLEIYLLVLRRGPTLESEEAFYAARHRRPGIVIGPLHSHSKAYPTTFPPDGIGRCPLVIEYSTARAYPFKTPTGELRSQSATICIATQLVRSCTRCRRRPPPPKSLCPRARAVALRRRRRRATAARPILHGHRRRWGARAPTHRRRP